MIRNSLLYIICLLAAALFASIEVEQLRVNTARKHAEVVALAASNLAAERDTTRDAAVGNERLSEILRDSLRLVERRIVQVSQRNDSLDVALGRERVARFALAAAIDTTRVETSAATITQADHAVRLASFNVRREPFTITADVAFPPAPDSASIALRVAVDAIPIEARVSCTTDRNGVREASLSASTPRWATVRIGHVEQEPGVCASANRATETRSRRRIVVHPLAITMGRIIWPDRGGRWGIVFGTTLSWS
jgi:hypothetical protein